MVILWVNRHKHSDQGAELLLLLFLISWFCFWTTRVRINAVEEWVEDWFTWLGFSEARMPEVKRPWTAWSVPSQVNQSSAQSCSIALIRASPFFFCWFFFNPNGSFGSKPDKSTQKCEEPIKVTQNDTHDESFCVYWLILLPFNFE